MEKIVIGVADLAAQHGAVEWAIRRSEHHRCHVVLVRAFDLVVSDPVVEQRRLDELRTAWLRRSPETVVETSIVTSSVPSALLEASRDADLLVVGTHRRHPFLSAMAGSLPLRVAAQSHCATVLVPEDWAPSLRRRVVLGLAADGSSDRAALFAAREAAGTLAELEVVHAWTASVPSVREEEPSPERLAHRRILQEALDRIRAAYPRVRLRGLLGQRPPVSLLAGRADDAEMLVLGSHRHAIGITLGTCARDLVPLSATPMCIVPPAVRSRVDGGVPAAAGAAAG